MSADARELRQKLAQDGFVLLERALNDAFMVDFRAVLLRHLQPKKGQSGKVDALGRLAKTRILLEQSELFTRVADVLDFRPSYCHHSDIQKNRTVSWHRDSINGLPYYDFCKTEIFATGDYSVYKLCIYCQDHTEEGGLSVIPGSHLKDGPPAVNQGVAIRSRLGDVILFDTRLYHKGIASLDERGGPDDRLSCFMTLARDNQITREFVNATIWRQNRQLKRTAYTLPEGLAVLLARVNLPPIPYEASPRPSRRSILPTLLLRALYFVIKRVAQARPRR